MWFLSARQAHRNQLARYGSNGFRPSLESLEDRCLLSLGAGSLDPTFGSGGTVFTASTVVNLPGAVVVQPDGKIVLAGNNNVNQWALERFNSDGSVDKTFGTSGTGIVSSMLTSSTNGSNIYGLAIDATGDIVAVGNACVSANGNSDLVTAVARYKTDGSLDPAFGNGQGFVVTNVNPYSPKTSKNPGSFGAERATAVAIQADGKIVVGGTVSTTGLWGVYSTFDLLRYNADGTLDNSFGNQSPKNGINSTSPFGGNGDFASSLALQSDGSIVLAGQATNFVTIHNKSYSYTSMAVARYTTAGQLDSSFGTSGTVTLDPSGIQTSTASDALIQSNGAIVLYGSNGANLTLARLQSNGQLDTSFAKSGFAVSSIQPDFTRYRGLAQGANGDLLAAGNSNGSMAVAAFLPGGAVDTTFGTRGITTVSFSSSAITTGLAVQRDGKIVVAGTTSPSNNYVLARFLPANTQIGWMTAAPNPVSSGASLTVSNISDNAYLNTTIIQVSFYQDMNGNGALDSTDQFLGTGTLNSATGIWAFTFSTASLVKGTYTLFAQAGDGNLLYAPLFIQVAVQ
jgi:uncharacterized delta-60 repeat protein